MFAQNDVTKFMGIPVDGFKSDMIQKLKGKGFVSSVNDKDVLEGEFNGVDVYVCPVTNNNKVYRIMLCDIHKMDRTSIKIRFNNLCHQFKKNSNYVSVDDYTIADNEDIGYEMSVHDKRYEALFYQKAVIDSIEIANRIRNEYAIRKYTQQELDNPTEDIKKDLEDAYLDLERLYKKYGTLKKIVWFMIAEYMGKYYITMYYDNEYNKANGEDL